MGTHSAPDLLLHLFAECDCIADLCILQSVHASLGEVRHYNVRAKLAVHTETQACNILFFTHGKLNRVMLKSETWRAVI